MLIIDIREALTSSISSQRKPWHMRLMSQLRKTRACPTWMMTTWTCRSWWNNILAHYFTVSFKCNTIFGVECHVHLIFCATLHAKYVQITHEFTCQHKKLELVFVRYPWETSRNVFVLETRKYSHGFIRKYSRVTLTCVMLYALLCSTQPINPIHTSPLFATVVMMVG